MVVVDNLIFSSSIDVFPSSCKDCILAHLATCEEREEEKRCPICSHGPIKVRSLMPIIFEVTDSVLQASQLLEVVRKSKNDEGLPGSQNSQPEVTLRRNDFNSSTKLEALVKNLRMHPEIFLPSKTNSGTLTFV
jgi:DNA repair protein RAD5